MEYGNQKMLYKLQHLPLSFKQTAVCHKFYGIQNNSDSWQSKVVEIFPAKFNMEQGKL